MNDVPDYGSYNEEQLQDALAHINRERFSANFAALQREIERRANQSPLPEVEPSSTHHLSSPRGCGFALGGCFCDAFAGVLGGVLLFSILAARLKASGVNPFGHDDWGFGLMGCWLFAVPLGAFIGVFVGIKRAERGQ